MDTSFEEAEAGDLPVEETAPNDEGAAEATAQLRALSVMQLAARSVVSHMRRLQEAMESPGFYSVESGPAADDSFKAEVRLSSAPTGGNHDAAQHFCMFEEDSDDDEVAHSDVAVQTAAKGSAILPMVAEVAVQHCAELCSAAQTDAMKLVVQATSTMGADLKNECETEVAMQASVEGWLGKPPAVGNSFSALAAEEPDIADHEGDEAVSDMVTPPVSPRGPMPAGSEITTPPLALAPQLASGAKWSSLADGLPSESVCAVLPAAEDSQWHAAPKRSKGKAGKHEGKGKDTKGSGKTDGGKANSKAKGSAPGEPDAAALVRIAAYDLEIARLRDLLKRRSSSGPSSGEWGIVCTACCGEAACLCGGIALGALPSQCL